MIAMIALGFAAFAAILILFTLFTGYLKDKDNRKREAFINPDHTLFEAKVTPGEFDDVSKLQPGAFGDITTEKLIVSSSLPSMSEDIAESNIGTMTSERCFRTDIGESLKKTRNYLQRTNNYMRKHPDSCSAPNHDLIGTFYEPRDGVGMSPPSGANYPKSIYA